LEFANAGGITGVFAAGSMTLTGPATLAVFENAIHNVKYKNLSDDPDESLRTIAFSAHDGSQGSAVVTRMMTVTGVNDAPIVDTSPGQTEYALSQLVVVDNGFEVNDVDSVDFNGASVEIIGGFTTGEDWLRFTNQNGISGDYDEVTGVLTLTGIASLEQYRTALRSVAYENTNDLPDLGTRTMAFEVDDDGEKSNTATKVVLMPIFIDGFEDRP
jgi:hypothetical protein